MNEPFCMCLWTDCIDETGVRYCPCPQHHGPGREPDLSHNARAVYGLYRENAPNQPLECRLPHPLEDEEPVFRVPRSAVPALPFVPRHPTAPRGGGYHIYYRCGGVFGQTNRRIEENTVVDSWCPTCLDQGKDLHQQRQQHRPTFQPYTGQPMPGAGGTRQEDERQRPQIPRERRRSPLPIDPREPSPTDRFIKPRNRSQEPRSPTDRFIVSSDRSPARQATQRTRDRDDNSRSHSPRDGTRRDDGGGRDDRRYRERERTDDPQPRSGQRQGSRS
jgi:hypothetical protein